MQGQYHLQALLGLNCGSSICLQEHIKESQKKNVRNCTNQSLIAEVGNYAWLWCPALRCDTKLCI